MKIISKNKKAYHEYEILEELQVGIELLGPEVKSLRGGGCNLKGSFCRIMKGEVWVFDAHISKYEYTDRFSKIEEKRTRKLLLNRKEIDKWQDKLKKEQHLTIIPLYIYFNEDGKIKLKIALCKGKKLYDKRASDKEKTIKRDLQKKEY